VVGTLVAVTFHAYAHGCYTRSAQTQDSLQDQTDETEIKFAGPEINNVELQVGNQGAVDKQEITDVADTDSVIVEEQVDDQDAPDEQENIDAAETDNVNVEEHGDDQGDPDTGVDVPKFEAISAPYFHPQYKAPKWND
jgi:hypothetical protein